METQKLDYIDAVRGWAILLVITHHVSTMFPEMPYPVKKLTNFGWHGVQLFFLASALTLLLSWHRTQVHDGSSIRSFFLRRFLRIAPMYYTGAVIYFIAEPPASGFDLSQMLISFTFLNVWRPEWIPTTPGWLVVPGGWSVGVEFIFYVLFPVLATIITSLSRAVAFFVAAFAFACLANHLGSFWLTEYSLDAARNFLYFWFPNQAPVFALGFILYFIVISRWMQAFQKKSAYAMLASVAVLLVVGAEYLSSGASFSWSNPVPPILYASLCFMVFIFTLSRHSNTLVTHPFIRKIGVLSFSSYILHFLFVHGLPLWLDGLINVKAIGYAAIANFVLLWALVLPATIGAAIATHVLIELPGIKLARHLSISRRVSSVPQKA